MGLSLMNKPEMESSGRYSAPEIYYKWKIKSTDKETMEEYLKKLQSKDIKIRNKYTKMWNIEDGMFDIMAFKTKIPKNRKSKHSSRTKLEDERVLALLECYYYLNMGFIPKDFIIKNAHKLNNIPGFIIHGRYDLICSPENSYLLSTKWTKGKLIINNMSGHSYKDENNAKSLLKASKYFEKFYNGVEKYYESNESSNLIDYKNGCYK